MHIGQRIKEVFEAKANKDHTIEWFAKELNCQRNNVYNIFKRSSIDTSVLLRICKILKHDFFLDLSNDLRGSRPSLDRERRIIHKEIMRTVSKNVRHLLARTTAIGHAARPVCINRKDGYLSALPYGPYRVEVNPCELPETVPYVKLIDTKEKVIMKVAIVTGKRLELRMVDKDKASEKYMQIQERLIRWFEEDSNLHTGQTNREVALYIYESMNP